jgi:hypothetical protein
LSGIFLCFTVFERITPERFPTSGNDRIRNIVTPMQSIEEFF